MAEDYIAGQIGDGAGRNAVGQDIQQLAGNSVHIELMERQLEVSQRETNEIARLTDQIGALSDDVTALTRALVGDSRFGALGLVQQVSEMSRLEARREHQRMLTVALLVVVVILQAVQWWLLWQVYQLYWVIYQAVNHA